jgi:steroid delta-isomerase-like uncharacterized protein
MKPNNPTLQTQFDAMNKHDPAKFVSVYHPKAEVFDPMAPDLLRGHDAIRKDMEEFIRAFPDLEVDIERAVEKDDTAAYEITMKGTHTGPLVSPTLELAPTNRKVKVGGGIFVRFDPDGRIVEERRYYDAAGLLGQLGVLEQGD